MKNEKDKDKDDKGLTPVQVASPRRSCSLSPADAASTAGWKRPWMSQVLKIEKSMNYISKPNYEEALYDFLKMYHKNGRKHS